ncbi:hypothetical protein OQA88_2844 [Cercophora sp. LCS_1]
MTDNNTLPILNKESESLSPLPIGHRHGLTAVAVLASLSFASSIIVLFCLTAKLVRWHVKTRRQRRASSHGFSDRPFAGEGYRDRLPEKPNKRPHLNQFLVLIYNLLLADIHQAAAFLLNARWVANDAIDIQSPACWIQGWLVSTGDLSSSLFITAIAVHTYLTVVWSFKPPQWALYVTVVFLWAFNYILAILGPAMTKNGSEHAGFYVRAVAWCWINVKYETYRLVFHYLFIFISLAGTSILYTLIFLHLRRRPASNSSPTKGRSHSSRNTNHHHKAFLLYPVIYVICTAPLAIGRIVAMVGVKVPIAYFSVAGALITSNGWLDVLLWGLTRKNLLFNSQVDSEDTGLDTFTFMRTPPGRKYGNMVWVEGAGSTLRHAGGVEFGQPRTRKAPGWRKQATGWRRLGLPRRGETRGRAKTASQESLRGGIGVGAHGDDNRTIHMDMVTSVVIEKDTEVGEISKVRLGPGYGERDDRPLPGFVTGEKILGGYEKFEK